MGSNNNRIRFDIDFNYNKSVINEALKSLDQLKRMTTGDLLQIKPEMDLTEATIKIESLKSDCQQLQSILTAAFNPKIGAVNIESFNSLIKQSYGSVSKLYNKFSEFGAAGKNAFLDMESAVLSSNTKLVKTQSLIDKIGVTLGNTIKWNISSSAINGIINKTREAYGYVKALDSSLNDIQIVTQKSADEMDRFARKANDAASALGRTTTDYTDAALTFYQQGLSDEEVQARTDLTLKVANTSGLKAEDAAEYVTAVLNGYKVGSEEAEKAMDVLANVGAHTASSLSELSEAMSKVSSTANTMGVSEEQLAASLATVIQVTRQDASQVGTAFKTIYMRISDIAAGTEDAEVSLGNYTSEMAQLGYNVLDSSGQLRDLGEVIEEIGGNWQNMSREQQIALARTMAGTRQANNLLALFDNWGTYSDAIKYASDATGTLQQQQDTYMESTAAHLRDMSASYEDLYDSILDADTIDAFAVGLSKIGKFLANFVDAIGGGKGLLLSLGSIGLRVFNDQIGKSLAQLGKKTQAQIELQEHYNEIIATSGQFSEEEFGDSGVKELAETYKTIASIKGKISEEDARQLEQYAQQLQYQLKQRNILIEQRDILQQSINEQASSESSQILKTIKSDSTFGGIDKSNINSVESFNTIIDSINQNLIKTSRSINSLKGKITSAFKNNDIVKAESGFNKLSNSVQGLVQKFGLADIEDEDLKASLKELASKQEEANNAFSSGDIDLAKEKTKEYNNAINALINKYKEYLVKAKEGANEGLFKQEAIQKAKELEELLKSLGINVDKINEAIDETAQNANKADLIGNIVEGIGAIGQIVSAVSALKNIYSITTDEDLSSSEKFLQVAQSLTMIVPMVITSVKKLGESFAIETIQAGIASQELKGMEAAQYALNTAMKSNPVLFFVTALTTLIGVISAVAEIYDRTHMSVKEANEALDQYNGKVSELNSTRSNNKQQIEELEELRDRYDELSKIAGPYDENIELLDEESAKEYLSIKEKIAELNEDSIAYYNSEGEVILKNNDSLDDTIEKLKEKNELEAKSLYNSKEQKEADKANYTLAKDAAEKLKLANEELDAYKDEDGTSKDGTSRKEIINNTLQDWLSRVQLQLSDKNLQLLTNEKMENTDKTLFEVLSSGNFEEIETYQKEIRSQIKKISDKEEELGRYGSVNTLSLWAEEYEDQVIGVGEKLESAQKEAKEAVDNLSPLDVNEYLNKMQFNYDYSSTWNTTLSEFEEKFGEEGYDFMTKIVSSFISGMSRFNEDGAPKTEEEIMGEINEFTELIRNLTPKNKNELDELYNRYNNLGNYTDARDRTKQTVDALNELRKSTFSEDNGYSEDDFEAIVKGILGFSNITFDNGEIVSYADQYTNKINQALEGIHIADNGDKELKRITLKNAVFARGLEDSLDKIPEAYSHVADNVVKTEDKLKAALDYVDWTNNISSASNLLELQSAFNDIPKNVEASYNEYANKLIDLAKAYENCTGEIEKYNKALRTGIISEIESAQAKLESSLVIGEASEKYDLEADNLETQAELLAQEYGITDQQAARLAVTNTRLNRGVSDLSSNWEKWSKILKSGSTTNSEYAETITDLRSAVADLLGVAEDTDIPLEFLQGHLKEIEKAAKGDIKSINKLGTELAKNTIQNIDAVDARAWAVKDEQGNLLNESPWDDTGFTDTKNTILEGIDQIHNKISELGDDAKNINLADIMGGKESAQEWVDELNEMARATQMSVADMNSLLSELNLDAELVTVNQDTYTEIPRYKITNKVIAFDNGYPSEIESEVTPMEPKRVPGKIGVAQINTGDDIGTLPKVTSVDRGSVSKPSSNTTSSSSKKTPNKAYTSKKDPYHDINIRIEKLSNSYSKLQKSQEKLTGDQLTKNLDKQLSILNDQVSAYEEKLDIAKKVAEEQKQELINSLNSGSLEIRISADDFTADGNLAEGVYEKIVSQYEAMIKKYDNRVLSDAEQETYDKLTEEYDNWLSKLSNYEETINSTMTEISDNLSDITDSLVDINLLKLKVQLDINLNVQEAIEQFKEFENRIIKGLKSDSIEYQINMAMTDITKVFDSKVLEEQMNVVNKVRQAYEQELAGVRSELFMGDLSKATETLEENLNNLRDIIIGLADSWDSLEEVGVSAIGAIADAFENKSSTLQFFESQIDHDLALIEKTYGETAYDKMVDFYNKKQVLIESQLVNAQTQVDVLYAEMINAAQKYGTDSDIYKEIVSRWESACQSLNSVFEASAENLQNIYQNAINNISSSFVKSITGGFSTETIDYTLSLLDKQMSSVLDNIQADLAIQKFENTWAKAINNSSSDKYKKNLESIVKTQLDGLQVLAEENLLSQNRVDLAEKYLQWQQAIMDLEETRNNKTTMRLRRDASGNYSYQYVASTNDILDAQQAALEKQDDYYNALLNNIKGVFDNINSELNNSTVSFAESLDKIQSDSSLSDTQKQKAIEELISNYETVFGSIINSQLTTDAKSLLQQYLELTGNDQIDSIGSKFFSSSILSELMNGDYNVRDLANQFLSAISDKNIKLEDLYAGSTEDSNKIFSTLDDLISSNDEMINSAVSDLDYFKETYSTLQEWYQLYKSLYNDSVNSTLLGYNSYIGQNSSNMKGTSSLTNIGNYSNLVNSAIQNGLNATNAILSNLSTSNLGSSISSLDREGIDQIVNISATFTDATTANEITAALSNLVNTATQYAYTKKN